MKPNKSILYILPLIKGWSADADYPINCFANTIYPDCLVVRYSKVSIQHLEGIISNENEEHIDIIHLIKQCFVDDYKLLLQGKYSKISTEAKSSILAKAPTTRDFQVMEGILYKNKVAKKCLETRLEIANLDDYIDEYESIMGEEEILIMEEV